MISICHFFLLWNHIMYSIVSIFVIYTSTLVSGTSHMLETLHVENLFVKLTKNSHKLLLSPTTPYLILLNKNQKVYQTSLHQAIEQENPHPLLKNAHTSQQIY